MTRELDPPSARTRRLAALLEQLDEPEPEREPTLAELIEPDRSTRAASIA